MTDVVPHLLLDAALILLALALALAMVRVTVGPTDADRALAVDFGFAAFIAAVALLAVRLDEPVLLDLVLVATLVGFLATIAIARLVTRRSL
ncbi:monovalent cation/H+ antiporter complex subunit F [Blastococcus sp. PRF04-17]|uniref:monovalent cation/H+ antiporter complex subunit F n=1 Tax=Blastococcus sp. PRF04-17 TaxID=2933797 RepID=UPI001FF5DC6F|nr:monovalent cation/H+ antiporter complex subunit F [Blastococcus sp. PRF04-17]UOX99958.1 monovalent cation/H+ antiporter complex subunit F [Blastococcus sp. PRF04-17]